MLLDRTEWESTDGWRPIKKPFPATGMYVLGVGFYGHGVLQTPQQIVSRIPLRPDTVAMRERDTLLLGAICRYFNTGGTNAELQELLDASLPYLQEVQIPGGWELLSTQLTTVPPVSDDLTDLGEPAYQHIFVQAGTDQALVWQEDVRVYLTTLQELVKQYSPVERDTIPFPGLDNEHARPTPAALPAPADCSQAESSENFDFESAEEQEACRPQVQRTQLSVAGEAQGRSV